MNSLGQWYKRWRERRFDTALELLLWWFCFVSDYYFFHFQIQILDPLIMSVFESRPKGDSLNIIGSLVG